MPLAGGIHDGFPENMGACWPCAPKEKDDQQQFKARKGPAVDEHEPAQSQDGPKGVTLSCAVNSGESVPKAQNPYGANQKEEQSRADEQDADGI